MGSIIIDNQNYATVTIGTQVWTTENYSGPGGREPSPSTGVTLNYGRYYKLDDLNGIKLPAGWRIPSQEDYNELMSNYATVKNSEGNWVINDKEQAKKLMSINDWYLFNGTNASGFNALPAGNYIIGSNGINFLNDKAYFLTTTMSGELKNLNVAIMFTDDLDFEKPFKGWYVRLVKQREGIDLHYQSVRFVKDL